MKRRITVLLVLLFVSAPSCGGGAGDGGTARDARDEGGSTTDPPERSHHVAPGGDDDGPGTSERPWETFGHALAQLRPGDELVVHGGEYRERIRDVDVTPGTPSAPITVRAAPAERAVVRGLLWLMNPSYWQIEGINVTWDDRNRSDEHMVKFSGGEGWSFTHAEVWDARSYAAILVAGDAARFRLAYLYVHDTHPANGRNEDHLVYLNSGTGGGVVERNILAGSPNGRAVKIGPGERDGPAVANVTVRYNTMFDNRGPSNVQLAWRSHDNRIERNVMVGAADGRHNVTGYELSGGRNTVADNIGWLSEGVVEDTAGLVDGTGNRHLDPRLADPRNGDFRALNRSARDYGRYAPGDS